jgi:hypothetical protein
MPVNDLQDSLDILRRNGPQGDWRVTWFPPCNAAAIEEAESTLDAALPSDLKSFYLCSDGLFLATPVPGWVLPSEIYILRLQTMIELAATLRRHAAERSTRRYPYIAFGDYMDGNYYAFDTGRRNGAYPYTVVAGDHDDRDWSRLPPIAESFADLLRRSLAEARQRRPLLYWAAADSD